MKVCRVCLTFCVFKLCLRLAQPSVGLVTQSNRIEAFGRLLQRMPVDPEVAILVMNGVAWWTLWSHSQDRDKGI